MTENGPDWDAIAEEAERSPKALLDAIERQIDRVDTLFIAATYKNEAGDDVWFFNWAGSGMKAIGMLRAAEQQIKDQALDGFEPLEADDAL
jgi:hypothetical protein